MNYGFAVEYGDLAEDSVLPTLSDLDALGDDETFTPRGSQDDGPSPFSDTPEAAALWMEEMSSRRPVLNF